MPIPLMVKGPDQLRRIVPFLDSEKIFPTIQRGHYEKTEKREDLSRKSFLHTIIDVYGIYIQQTATHSSPLLNS